MAAKGMTPVYALMAASVMLAACPSQESGAADRAAADSPQPDAQAAPAAQQLTGDSSRGSQLFVEKGCVICHSVRGVGGKAAPPLDAGDYYGDTDALSFAGRMWAGAPIMVELQRIEMGYQINLDGEDIAHLAAFARDKAAQEAFTEDAVPVGMRSLLLDQIYMEDDLADRYRGEEWYDFNDMAEPEE